MYTLGLVLAASLFALAIFVALGVGLYIIRELRREQRTPHTSIPSSDTTGPASAPATVPLRAHADNAKLSAQPVMSRAESRFYDFLKDVLTAQFLIETKTPLSDVVARHGWLENGLYRMHKWGHVDFLVLDPMTKSPLLAIELDDVRHGLPERQERDRRKDELLRRANIKLLRFRAGKFWGEAERQAILGALFRQAT